MKMLTIKTGAYATFAAAAALALAGCGSADKAAEETKVENVEVPAEGAMSEVDAGAAPMAEASVAATDAAAAPEAAASAAAEKATTEAEKKM